MLTLPIIVPTVFRCFACAIGKSALHDVKDICNYSPIRSFHIQQCSCSVPARDSFAPWASFNIYAQLHVTLKHSAHGNQEKVDYSPPEGCALSGHPLDLVEGPALLILT